MLLLPAPEGAEIIIILPVFLIGLLIFLLPKVPK
jgi:hypothetical protein